jgi:hypothetical protein
MVKMTLAGIRFYLILLVFFTGLVSEAAEPVKKLYYQYNDKVVIWITNQPCSNKNISKEYPYFTMATRIDGDALPGCFTNVGDDIKIQWIGGDFSVFPANVFLIPVLKGDI